MYPESFIKEIESSITLSDIIGRKIALKRRGKDFVACCPFHHEKTPSFSVSDMKGIYHCFGCGKSGNAFTFLMETEGMNFKEVVEYLANISGLQLPKIEKKNLIKKEDVDEIELIYKINEETCKFFQENLYKFYGKTALLYANKRGLNTSSINKFRIGFASDDFHSLFDYLKSLNFKEDIIEKSGVISKGDKGFYDKFRNRLMFPIFDKKGRVIAFTGRILNDGMPKYMNSPETKIYIKGKVLFNYYFARKNIYDLDFAVLVEGNMDAISLFINGIENVVAPMGTGITENQIKELWSATNNIFVCLDGDSAGQKASQRLSKLVLPIIKTGKNIKFAFLPKNVDPDDFIRNYGKIEFDNLLRNSISLSDYLWYNELQFLNINETENIIPEKKAELEKNINKTLSVINDNSLKNHFSQFYKGKLWNLSKNISNKNKITTVLSAKNYEKEINLIDKNENRICSLLIKFPSLVSSLMGKYKVSLFDINFNSDFSNSIINILEEYLCFENNKNNLNDILVKNGFNDYINNGDIFLNSFCGDNLNEEKCLEMLNILLLERELILLNVDLKNASEIGDIVKTKKLGEKILNLKNRINSSLSESSFV